jgi:hypothetical protein
VRHKKARKKKRAENKARSEQRRLEKGKQCREPVKQNKLGYKKRLMELVPFGFNASLMQKLQLYPELHDYVWRAENLHYRQSRARQLADMKATYRELNKELAIKQRLLAAKRSASKTEKCSPTIEQLERSKLQLEQIEKLKERRTNERLSRSDYETKSTAEAIRGAKTYENNQFRRMAKKSYTKREQLRKIKALCQNIRKEAKNGNSA